MSRENAYARDIGSAQTSVHLGFWESNLYNANGYTINESAVGNANDESEARATHFAGYQECWLETTNTQLSQRENYTRLYPAEAWQAGWDLTSPQNWEQLPQIGGLKLAHNPEPDAPKQTVIFGRLQGSDMNDIPDLYVADGLYPLASEYVNIDTDIGPTVSSEGGGIASGTEDPYYPADIGVVGTPENFSTLQQVMHNDVPFKASNIGFIASSSDEHPYRKAIALNGGIRIQNVWEMKYPTPTRDSRRYLANHGPVAWDSSYSGPIAAQEGAPGNLRVRVISNRGTATMSRILPMEQCIGRDKDYPWIFPYIDNAGKINHDICVSSTGVEMVGTSSGGSWQEEGTSPPNIGFVLEMDVTSESQRGSFFGKGGGSPSVTISWGKDWGKEPGRRSEGSWARGFTVIASPNKIPYIYYYDGYRSVRVLLNGGMPIGPWTSESKVHLRVEYHGTAMFVWFNRGDVTCIRGHTPGNTEAPRYGVYVNQNKIRFTIANASAIFSFMPVYHNPWAPAQMADWVSGSTLQVDTTDIPRVVGNNNYNQLLEFYNYVSDGDLNTKFRQGLAKLSGGAVFKLPTGVTPSAAILADIVDRAIKQSPTPTEIMSGTTYWLNNSAGDSKPYYHRDEGLPCLIRDSRHYPASYENSLPLYFYEDVGYQWHPSVPMKYGNGLPTIMTADSTTYGILFSAFVTHTTPVIFGFKLYDKGPRPKAVNEDNSNAVSLPVTDWSINWAAESSEPGSIGKVMRATAKVTVVNPPGNVIRAVMRNQMRLWIDRTGYNAAKDPMVGNAHKRAVYCEAKIFEGITIRARLSRTSGGKVLLTIEAVDPIRMLERALIETNLRFDGCSYLMAIALLFRHSEYEGMFQIRLGNGKPITNMGCKWMNDGFRRTADLSNVANIYGMLYFGYQPVAGRSYEVNPGEKFMDCVNGVLSKMDDPRFIPLFYYDPTEGMFVLTMRRNGDTGQGAPIGTATPAPSSHPWIIDSPQIVTGSGWGANSVTCGLPLQAAKGQSLYTIESNTEHLASHFVVIGQNRVTSAPMKGTAMNPSWNSLKGTTSSDQWGDKFGHLGYRSKAFTNMNSMIVDQQAAWLFASGRMWWLMRPVISIQNMEVNAVLFPGSQKGGLTDGTIGVVIGSDVYRNALLDKATINYNAEDDRVWTELSAWVFPTTVR